MFILGECCTVTIGEHTSDILPRECGVFNAVILRLDEGLPDTRRRTRLEVEWMGDDC
jgi:hypothetical protein